MCRCKKVECALGQLPFLELCIRLLATLMMSGSFTDRLECTKHVGTSDILCTLQVSRIIENQRKLDAVGLFGRDLDLALEVVRLGAQLAIPHTREIQMAPVLPDVCSAFWCQHFAAPAGHID